MSWVLSILGVPVEKSKMESESVSQSSRLENRSRMGALEYVKRVANEAGGFREKRLGDGASAMS